MASRLVGKGAKFNDFPPATNGSEGGWRALRVQADLEDDVDRTAESEATHARLIASLPSQEPAIATALPLCWNTRHGWPETHTLTDRSKDDLLAEDDFWATEAKREIVTRDVERV